MQWTMQIYQYKEGICNSVLHVLLLDNLMQNCGDDQLKMYWLSTV